MKPNYSIIRCYTNDKNLVMDLLCDADMYKRVNDHVDVLYDNGDTKLEKKQTKQLVKDNITKLNSNGIKAETKMEFLDEWLFLYK